MKSKLKYLKNLKERVNTIDDDTSNMLHESAIKKKNLQNKDVDFEQDLQDTIDSIDTENMSVPDLIEDNILMRLENEQLRKELSETKSKLADLKTSKYQ